MARLGGDEFTVLAEGIDDVQAATSIAQATVDALRASFTIFGKRVAVTPSVGLALFPDDAVEAERLLANADAAMYVAKRDGGNHHRRLRAG